MSTTLMSVALLGLLAGGATCAAAQGGLLAGLVARQGSGAAADTGGASDDLAPVGGFLAGKLVSHALLGALLGALGAIAQLSLQVRATAQLAAGALIVVMGLAQLGVPGVRALAFSPPASWARLVRGRARSASMFAPAILGLSTILIPCGVTLSVTALAIASGSPLHGAAIMAVFVAGTAPLFTVVGYLAARARRAAGPWRHRLAVATGVVVLATGLYTLDGGLELTGSHLAPSNLAAALGLGAGPAVAADPPDGQLVTVADGRQTVVVTAVTTGYEPMNLRVDAGIPTTMVVRARDAHGCVRSFVIPGLKMERVLPVNGDTAISIGVLQPGILRYSCAMGMYTGRLTVVAAAS